jgi:hypothetical protein
VRRPLHLVAHLAVFAVAAYAIEQVISVNFLVWFAGAAVVHDIVVLPLYSVIDRLAQVNYFRVPAAISALLLLVYFPLILRLSDGRYFAASGHHIGGAYLRNWLLITAALFAGSGLVYAVRRR